MRLEPELLLAGDRWEKGWSVRVEDGRIAEVGPTPPGVAVERLPRRALIPGAVNAHSHSFQRAIRGRTEYREADKEDFWTWRERMYEAAMRLTPEEVERVARLAFVEMLQNGITTCGEFHYLHHQPDGRPYADPDELARRVLGAAQWAGIRLVLLRVAYARAGCGKAANPLQARFIDPRPEMAVESAERLAREGYAVGLAPHSLRAVPLEWLRHYVGWNGPLHMHVAEQPREIDEVLAEHGCRPFQLLQREGLLHERFVAVHAIHLEPAEIEAMNASLVCSCPTTERNLGDGIVPAAQLLRAGVRICLGTDSQCQIDLYEDARQLEYHLRLQHRQRAMLPGQGEGPDSLARAVWPSLNQYGAEALGVEAGQITPGQAADLVAVRLDDPALAGAQPDELLATLVFNLGRPAIDRVWVGGIEMLADGKHPRQEEAVRDFARVMRGLCPS